MLIIAVLALVPALKPPLAARTEIFDGIYYHCIDLEAETIGEGRVLALEVHLGRPGVQVRNRALSAKAVAEGHQFDLRFADAEVARHGLAALMNTSFYYPGEWFRSLPGNLVSSGGTLVWDGSASHRGGHSYLLWSDENHRLHLETSKPPSEDVLARARWGLGVGGIQVHNGRPQPQAIDDKERVMPRTFIGIGEDPSTLWLIAFDNADAWTMMRVAIQLGVRDGAMLDSGDATNLVIGSGARDLPAHTGIRHLRPLGPYLAIEANPLPPERRSREGVATR